VTGPVLGPGERVLVQRGLPAEPRTGLRGLVQGLTDWPLSRRVLAVVAIPVVATLAIGGVRVHDLLGSAAAAAADATVSRAQQAAADLAAAVGEEQLATAAHPVAPGLRITPGEVPAGAAPDDSADVPDLTRARGATDAAAGRLDRAVTAVVEPGEDVRTRALSVTAALDRLDGIRAEVDGADLPAAGTVAAIRGMTEVSGAALRLGDALAAELTDVAGQPLARAGQALVAANRQQALQDALVLVAVTRPADRAVASAELRSAETARLAAVAAFRRAADPEQRRALDAALDPGIGTDRSDALWLVVAATETPAPGPHGAGAAVPASEWWRLASAASLDEGRRSLHSRQVARAEALRRDRTERAAVEGAAALALLAAGLVVTLVAARSILLPLRRLRADAIMIAEERLPAAISRIREAGLAGPDGSDSWDVRVQPVDVRSSEEIGQVARAFDAVHVEAVRLAAEQERLRRNVNELFVNLSRRSQALVERQLALIDRLENDEADPDQLAQLFRLDHLAARMRRNNDNLMVLAGTPTAPGSARAITVLDVVRAAISETEHYERVTVRGVAPATVTGAVSHDLVHLLAELLDNATVYSPPDTTVAVDVTTGVGAGPAAGARIVVTDRGLGIPPDVLADLNARLAAPPVADAGVARRMGLYVVAHLAARHGIEVRLAPGAGGRGTTAEVDVPAAALTALGEAGGPDAAGDGRRGEAGPTERARAVPAPPVPGPREVPAAVTGAGDLTGNPTGDPAGDPDDQALDEAADEVGTPIFHELSAWFLASSRLPPADRPDRPADRPDRPEARTETPSPGPTAAVPTVPPPLADPAPDRFAGAADEGWRAVAAVARARPTGTTAAGLPRRRPMALRVPGSVAPAPDETARRGRDAASVRRHLTAYQRGLQEGRRRAGTPPGGVPDGAPHVPAVPGPGGGAGHGDEEHRR